MSAKVEQRRNAATAARIVAGHLDDLQLEIDEALTQEGAREYERGCREQAEADEKICRERYSSARLMMHNTRDPARSVRYEHWASGCADCAEAIAAEQRK